MQGAVTLVHYCLLSIGLQTRPCPVGLASFAPDPSGLSCSNGRPPPLAPPLTTCPTADKRRDQRQTHVRDNDGDADDNCNGDDNGDDDDNGDNDDDDEDDDDDDDGGREYREEKVESEIQEHKSKSVDEREQEEEKRKKKRGVKCRIFRHMHTIAMSISQCCIMSGDLLKDCLASSVGLACVRFSLTSPRLTESASLILLEHETKLSDDIILSDMPCFEKAVGRGAEAKKPKGRSAYAEIERQRGTDRVHRQRGR
ncbi:hypothetical protein PoB_006389300 [Plakobranchus ocellatus]|uniref:Uncharacterized protein n=1 Tax=Plakobranchus ocellatus TaxID=259542 RepID=A0AAV4D014_9GAST|nr:hypothetical protein PoB_006389300 [Plakobranchus ocellatus]